VSFLKEALSMQARDLAKIAIWYGLNRHRQGTEKNIWIFGSRRSGTTLVAQVFGANKGLKVIDQPFALATSTALQMRYLFQFDNGHAVDLTDEEKIQCKQYVDLMRSGRLHVGEPWRFWAYNFHFHSNRLVFKETNGSCLAPLMYETYGDHILVLFRHPIPQSMSCFRNGWELNYRPFLGSKWYIETYLKDGLEGFCHDLIRGDKRLDKFVLVWCLENLPLFANLSAYPDWGFITYEHFIQHAADVVRCWAQAYGLSELNAMMRAAQQPSVSTRKLSTTQAKDAIRANRTRDVLFSWRSRIAAEDERRLMAIVERFQIDEYEVFETSTKRGFRAPATVTARSAPGIERSQVPDLEGAAASLRRAG